MAGVVGKSTIAHVVPPACPPAVASRLAFRGAEIFLDSTSFDKCARSAERENTYIRTLRRASSIPTSYLIWDPFNGMCPCACAYTLYICLLHTQRSARVASISACCNGCIFSGVCLCARTSEPAAYVCAPLTTSRCNQATFTETANMLFVCVNIAVRAPGSPDAIQLQ